MRISTTAMLLAFGTMVACGTAEGPDGSVVAVQDDVVRADYFEEEPGNETAPEIATDDLLGGELGEPQSLGEGEPTLRDPDADGGLADPGDELPGIIDEQASESEALHGAAANVRSGHVSGSMGFPGQVHELPFGHRENEGRKGYYYVSRNNRRGGRPLLVLFHGLRGTGEYVINYFAPLAEKYNLALLAPDSAGDKWEIGSKGHDTNDVRHALEGMIWLRQHTAGHLSRANVSAIGHSYGTRMATYIATNHSSFTSVVLSHGRFTPESLGARKVPAYFSGSPRDNQFSFAVMKQQEPQWRGGNHGSSSLHTFDCDSCEHYPLGAEISAIAGFVTTH